MRYIIGFFVAAFISTFTLYGALFSKDGYSWTVIIVAYSVWGLWIAAVVKPNKEKANEEKESDCLMNIYVNRLDDSIAVFRNSYL